MKKQLFFALSLTLGLLFSSCNKDMAGLDPSLFKCNPNPLVVKGGKIDATITGTFPVKYFNKKATVVVTPVLKFAGKEEKGTPVTYQGEKVVGNNQQIAYKAGGIYTIKTQFDYKPEMEECELYLQFEVSTKKKQYQIPSVKVADGVITTAQLVSFRTNDIAPVIIPDKFQRIFQETQEAEVLFLIQNSNLRNSETKKVLDLTKKINSVATDSNRKVSGLEVSAYASPDGGLDLNTNLAEKRKQVTTNYIGRELKKVKASVTIDSKFTAEDWAGFQELVSKSNIQDKEVILRVLSMYTDPEQREAEIKNLSAAYKTIADEILPQLRRSRLKLTIDVIGKSNELISKLAKENPTQLSVDELLYAATLVSSLDEKASIYLKVTQLFPTDLRGYNNLGVINYQQNNFDDASRMFAKALEIDSRLADLNFNAGVSALNAGDLSKATQYFGKAAGTKGNLAESLGSIYIIRGDYPKAKTTLGDSKSNNAALLQLLMEDYSAARKTISALATPDATTSYLSAIIGARTNDRDLVIKSLKEAVKLDSKYGPKALKDLEFAKYRTEEAFLSIAK
jgi:tetratricopeptide (TPR) repeat protein